MKPPRYKAGHPAAPLTDAGWPRPHVKTAIGTLPVPWTAPPNQLAVMDGDRVQLCEDGGLCQVCGLENDREAGAYAFVKDSARKWQRAEQWAALCADADRRADMELHAMDQSVMHLKCATLAASMCPRLLKLQATWKLAVFKVPTHAGSVFPGTAVEWFADRIAQNITWPRVGRRTPYSEIGIARLPCFRCGRQGAHQWSVCADDNLYRVLCVACDVELNELALTWVGDPDAKQKAADYRRRALA